MTPQKSSGFTLIELLVVIAIIGLLSSIVLASLNTTRLKGRDAARREDIHSIQVALELYYNTNNEYPISGGSRSYAGWSSSQNGSWTTLGSALAPFISKLPIDPAQDGIGFSGYGYNAFYYFSGGYGCPRQWYMIVYHLEASTVSNQTGVTTCNGTNFNYGRTQPKIVTVGMNGSGH